MADDLGFETLGVNGSDSYQTPYLDSLAAGGMNFSQCYSMPLCTPSRVQLMTGKYNFRNYIGFGLLDPEEKTFGDYLTEAEYKTFVAGKWQLLGNEHQRNLAGGRVGSHPLEAGFEDYCLWQVDELGSRYKDPLLSNPNGNQVYEGEYGPDIITESILEFIEDNQSDPFFVYYPMVLTHDPFVPSPSNASFSDFDASSKVNDPIYFAEMVEYMDLLVGKIWTKVEELGMAENTLIVFIGDNGTDRKVLSMQNGMEIQGDKGHPTAAGTHVPMLAYWKGRIASGSTNDHLIDFADFMPTLWDLAGIEEVDRGFTDGISFYSQLLGKESLSREWIYCDYDPRWGKHQPSRHIQNKEWKLYDDGRIFNIQNDPFERKELSLAEISDFGLRRINSFKDILHNIGK
ncbi:arylsulfatase [Echinicola pacifica]|uniref:Arylsulfatase n=2 Tax=Echinicola pacifica TaxID=346377 RepID=A0A918UMG8_9BACT|nr:arylsulfatase [Echinicola pacifica]